MKYVAVSDTEGETKYIAAVETDRNLDFCTFQEMLSCGGVLIPHTHTVGKSKVQKAPEPMEYEEYRSRFYVDGYNQALRDCRVLKDED